MLCCTFLALSSATGCTLEAIEIPPDDDAAMETMVREIVAQARYRTSEYRRMNGAPYPTELHDTDRINVYAPDWAVADYARIEPARAGSGMAMDPDCVIVREVIGDDGAVSKVTVMAKAEPGYYPEGGDYYYGVLSPDGQRFVTGDDGRTLSGRLDLCATCHADRAGDDYLFGVPAEYR